MSKAVVTGAAGFVGSHMVDKLVSKGWDVLAIDNLSAGKLEFLKQHEDSKNFRFVQADIKDGERLVELFRGVDTVFHFAANADVKGGVDNPTVDLRENAIGTSNVLEAMRLNKVKKIVFSSTGSIYGEPDIHPTPEDAPFPVQTSMYGASKLYNEGLIQSYCEAYGMKCWIFRFVSVLGERYTHGVIFSFLQQLAKDPIRLTFLSDGTPLKSYQYIGDCIEGIWFAFTNSNNKVNIFNLGTEEEIRVKDLADLVVSRLGYENVEYIFGPNPRGWIGDSPRIILDISKIKRLGWQPKTSIKQAIHKTIDYLIANRHLLEGNYFRKNK